MKPSCILALQALICLLLTAPRLESQRLSWNKLSNLPARPVQSLHAAEYGSLFVTLDNTPLRKRGNTGIPESCTIASHCSPES